MSNQVAMSVRLDKGVSERLILESSVGERTRNRIINDAVRLYIEFSNGCRDVNAGKESSGHFLEDMYQRWSQYLKKRYVDSRYPDVNPSTF